MDLGAVFTSTQEFFEQAPALIRGAGPPLKDKHHISCSRSRASTEASLAVTRLTYHRREAEDLLLLFVKGKRTLF